MPLTFGNSLLVRSTDNGLSDRFRRLLHGVWHDLLILDQLIKALDQEIEALAANDPVAKRLQQLRGVGPMIATALLATVGDPSQFNNGRQMATSLGLTPKQMSSGGKSKLLGISKGDSNMRSVWLCTRNDALGNVAVIFAAIGVFGTGAAWPDLLVAIVMASLALHVSWSVLKHARTEMTAIQQVTK